MSDELKVPGHAFLSYVREDSAAVDRLERVLRAAGISVWRDADLLPGEDWRARIRQAITRDALAFIACFSTSSIRREISYQNEELTLAIEQFRLRSPDAAWLFPVRLDDCVVPDLDIGGGRTLASIQRADLFGERYDEGVARLVAAVLRILYKRADARANGQVDIPEGVWQELGTREELRTAHESSAGSVAPAWAVPAATGTQAGSPGADGYSSAMPELARLLFSSAEGTAVHIADPEHRAQALTRIVEALAGIDPARASVLAGWAADSAVDIPHREGDLPRARVQSALARAVAVFDASRAEGIARDITVQAEQARAFLAIAEVSDATDADCDSYVDQAERAARAVTDDNRRISVLLAVARAVSGEDPVRASGLVGEAEQAVGSLKYGTWRVRALVTIAEAVRADDAARASRLLDQAEQVAVRDGSASSLLEVAEVVRAESPDRAAGLADQAERMSDSSAWNRAESLLEIAAVVADFDPDRAGNLITQIEQLNRSSHSSSDWTVWYHQKRVNGLIASADIVCAFDPGRARALIRKADMAWGRHPNRDDEELVAEISEVMAAADLEGCLEFLDELSYFRSAGLEGVLPLVAAENPVRAQTIAMSVGSSDALASAAELAAATDARRAEVIARGIPDDYLRAAALARIASVVTAPPQDNQ